MQYGQVVGVKKPVSRLVHGTLFASSQTQEQDFRLFDTVWEAGANTFDTAHVYGNGESERTLGKWLRSRGVSKEAIIITKGAHPKADGLPRVTPEAITADLHDSLERLQVNSVDIYLLHRDNTAVSIPPILETLNEHYRAGRIKAFGGSNWSYQRIQEANDYAAQHNLEPFVATSPNFSLAVQTAPPWDGCQSISGVQFQAARQWYRAQNMPIFAWSSLAGGFFSGRFSRDNLDSFFDYFDQVCIETYCTEANFERLDRAKKMAQQKNMTVAQIALAYVINTPLNLFAIASSRTQDELHTNAAAAALVLSPEELNWLESGSPTP